jgi:hypothetical protein
MKKAKLNAIIETTKLSMTGMEKSAFVSALFDGSNYIERNSQISVGYGQVSGTRQISVVSSASAQVEYTDINPL